MQARRVAPGERGRSALPIAALFLLLPLGASATWAGEIEVAVQASPLAIYPRDVGGPCTSNITVTVYEDSVPAPDKSVRMSAAGIENMGGHIHDSTRPAGTFSPTTGKTNSQGRFASVYTASRVGGSENVRATAECVTSGVNLNIRVPYLSSLGSGSDYSLIGATTEHPDNHYGTGATNSALAGIAPEYHEEFPDDSVLCYNDISLVKGGIFDLDQNWQPKHYEYRIGRNCDLRISNVPEANRDRLREIIRLHGGDILEETDPPHWHLTF